MNKDKRFYIIAWTVFIVIIGLMLIIFFIKTKNNKETVSKNDDISKANNYLNKQVNETIFYDKNKSVYFLYIIKENGDIIPYVYYGNEVKDLQEDFKELQKVFRQEQSTGTDVITAFANGLDYVSGISTISVTKGEGNDTNLLRLNSTGYIDDDSYLYTTLYNYFNKTNIKVYVEFINSSEMREKMKE